MYKITKYASTQGGRSCTGARVAPAKNFGLRRKFQARTYAILSRFTHFLEDFGHIKSALLGKKKVFLGQEVHYNMVYSVYFTELDWKICNYAQK